LLSKGLVGAVALLLSESCQLDIEHVSHDHLGDEVARRDCSDCGHGRGGRGLGLCKSGRAQKSARRRKCNGKFHHFLLISLLELCPVRWNRMPRGFLPGCGHNVRRKGASHSALWPRVACDLEAPRTGRLLDPVGVPDASISDACRLAGTYAGRILK
jgi:hypothetical protein